MQINSASFLAANVFHCIGKFYLSSLMTSIVIDAIPQIEVTGVLERTARALRCACALMSNAAVGAAPTAASRLIESRHPKY